MGRNETGKVLQMKGLFILAICIVFTLLVFWVARVIHAVSVVWTSIVAICPPPVATSSSSSSSSSSALIRIQESKDKGVQGTCGTGECTNCDVTRESLHRKFVNSKG